MAFDTEKTLLVLDGMGIPLYSARGLSQTLAPLESAKQIMRTVNGGLIDFSGTQFRKYVTKISCTDQRAPRMDNVWPGQLVTIWSVCELSYVTGGTPSRGVVPGSYYEEGGFAFYRPILNCMLLQPSQTMEEYPVNVQWDLEFEEV